MCITSNEVMRALKCDASKGELSLEDVPVPEIINDDDVILKIGYAGLCGTDLHIIAVGQSCQDPGGDDEGDWRCY